MKPHTLTIRDKSLWERALSVRPHALSGYSFTNIFIWRRLFDIEWRVIRERLCLFFRNKAGCFMPVPPSGDPDAEVFEACFEAMEETNRNPAVSRIENVEALDAKFFHTIGWRTYEKSREYLVSTSATAGLRGDAFKHQRHLRNFFVKNFDGSLRDYTRADRKGVEALYAGWSSERKARHRDPVYQAMLEDSFGALRELLKSSEELGVTAKVVVIDDEIQAFTSGVALSKDVFCVNFEIVNLSFKGLAQYIFSAFAGTLSGYRLLNLMDDSGIDNIKRTKMSFKPLEVIPSLTAVKDT